MLPAGHLPFDLRRVVTVVAGKIHLAEVPERIAAVQLELGVDDLGVGLERGQMRLVVRIRERAAGLAGQGQRGQPVPDALRGQVLNPAVVLVPPARLARLRDIEVAEGAYPRAQLGAIHVPRRYRSGRPGIREVREPARPPLSRPGPGRSS